MRMMFDTLPINDGPRRTSDGFLIAEALCARTGVQIYSGDDVGRPDLKYVRVYRSPEVVFDKDSMHSYAYRPVTNGHPKDMVTSDNWRETAVGNVGDQVARDGEAIRVPLVLMDEKTIRAVESGKRELSLGYTCDLEFRDGVSPEGLQFDAVQTNIRANHLAVVDRARGGPTLRIGDEDMPEIALRTVQLDGLPIQTNDQGASAIEKLLTDRASVAASSLVATDAFNSKIAELTTALSTKDAEIAALGVKLKDSEITPEKMDAMRSSREGVISAAKKVLGDKLVTDGKTDPAIMREVVVAKMGDEKGKAYSDAEIKVAFGVLTDANTTQTTVRSDPALRDGIRTLPDKGAMDARDKAWLDGVERDRNAHKGPQKAA